MPPCLLLFPGAPFLPPRWALGYHQCRFSYETATRVKEVSLTPF